MSVVVIALLAMVGVFIKGNQLSANGEKITVATEVGMDVLEASKDLDFALIPSAGNFSSTNGDLPVNGFPPPPYQPDGSPVMVVRTSEISDTMKSVVVSVNHVRGQFVTLETYVRP